MALVLAAANTKCWLTMWLNVNPLHQLLWSTITDRLLLAKKNRQYKPSQKHRARTLIKVAKSMTFVDAL
jgi:hypothetical protein